MKISANPAKMSSDEILAMSAFWNVLAGREALSRRLEYTLPDPESEIQRFRKALNDEPAPENDKPFLDQVRDHAADMSGLAAAFDAIVPEVVEVAKDASGAVWQEDLHSTPPKLTESGLWRKRRERRQGVVSATLENEPEPLADKASEVVLSDPNPEPAIVDDASNSGQSEPETLNGAAGDADSTEPTFTDEEAEAPADEMSQEQQLFWHLIDGARTWISFKAAVLGFIKTPEFLMWHADDQQALREKVWKIATEDVGLDVQPTDDPTAFTLWMPTETDADEVARRFKLLKGDSDAYKRLPDESKARMDKSVSEWIAHLIA